MILKFATKRDINGNRKYLAIDTAKQEYATRPQTWICKGDFVEVKSSDLRAIIEKAERDGYNRIDTM